MDQCILKTDPLLICINRQHIFPMCTCELQKILYANTNPTFLCKYLSFEMKFGDFYWGRKCPLEQGICICLHVKHEIFKHSPSSEKCS